MVSRFVLTAYATSCALFGGALGIGHVALRTGAGRDVAVRYAVGALNKKLVGSATVGNLGGSITGGVELSNVVLMDEDSVALFDLPLISIRYRASDLIKGRVVLGQLRLTSPTFQITKHEDGSLNITTALGLGGGDGSGPAPLVAFNDVEITDGTVLLRTPLNESDSTSERDNAAGSPMRLRRFEDIQADLAYLRLSSPDSAEKGIRAEINGLSLAISDPDFSIDSLVGTIEIEGSSLALDIDELRLLNTQAAVRGEVTWPQGPPLFNLDVVAARVTSTDLPVTMVPIPDGLGGSGRFLIQSRGPDTLSVFGSDLDLRGENRGGGLTGRFGIVLGPDGQWDANSTALVMDNFDIEYFSLILDSLPVHGRLTGTLDADGPRQAVVTEIDWDFADSLANWDESRIVANGMVAIGDADGIAFDDFEISRGSFALSTIRLLVPAIDLQGILFGRGTLNGPWLEPSFDGDVRHEYGAAPSSRFTGTVQLNALGPTLGVWADLVFDSLNVEGIRGTYPDIPLFGAFGGNLSLRGYLDSLGFQTNLSGERGRVVANGALRLDDLIGFHEFEAALTEVELMRIIVDSLPPTRLTGSINGNLLGDPELVSADIGLDFIGATLNGFFTDSVKGRVRTEAGVVSFDSVRAWVPGGRGLASGTLGIRDTEVGELGLRVDVDSLSSGSEFFTWLLGSAEVDGFESIGSGPFDASLTISGNVEDYSVDGTARGETFTWGSLFLGGAQLSGSWAPDADSGLVLTARLDSLGMGQLAFSDLLLRTNGSSDSIGWFARARVGVDASWLAGGSWLKQDSGSLLPVDSMALLIPSDIWFLEEPEAIHLSSDGGRFGEIVLEGVRSGSRVTAEGALLPAGGSLIDMTVEGLLVEDVLALLQRDRNSGGGRISGTATLGGSLRDPAYALTLGVREGVWAGFPIPELRSSIDYRDSILDIDVSTFRLGSQEIKLLGTLPIDLGLRGVVERQVPGELDLTATAQELSVGFVDAVFEFARGAEGVIGANVHVGGSWEEPVLSGSASIRDGGAVFPSIRVRHSDMNGNATLSGDTIYVDSLSVTSGDGRANVSGFIHLENLTDPILALDLTARDFRALNIPNFLELTGSADLHFAGPVIGARATGSGEISHGVLYFADLFEKNIIDLDDPLLAGLIDTTLASVIREQGLGAAFSTRFLDSLLVDSVVVEMGNDMWMRSQEANIAITGNILAGKVGPNYRLDGTLNTPRGTYQLPNIRHSFTVTSGEVRYLGTPDLDALMNVSARHVLRAQTGETVTIFVNLGGTLYLPEVRLSSDINPPIPETEIVSYLISGSPSFQADESVRRAAFELVGALSGELSSFITDLGVPIDFFRIRPTEGADGTMSVSGAELSAGFQLFDSRLFVSASQLACPNREDQTGVGVEFRMSQELRFSLSRDPLTGCNVSGSTNPLSYQLGVDLFWEKKY